MALLKGLQVATLLLLSASLVRPTATEASERPRTSVITPKVFIISHFHLEGAVWYTDQSLNLLAHNITVPGFSPIFPNAHCSQDYSVCQLTTGEGVINAAVTLTSLVYSPLFDLRNTYFLIAGIGGANPERTTIGGVTFARYAVQVDLQHELDARERGINGSGYIALGASAPGQYPGFLYGTEVFELNGALRDRAMALSKSANLSDNDKTAAHRARYTDPAQAPARSSPVVTGCDVLTSNTWFNGEILSRTMESYAKMLTSGTAQYCITAQEDNATLEALLRGAQTERMNFSRVIILRAGSNFDRPYPGQEALDNLVNTFGDGFSLSITNIYRAGIKVVNGILRDWNTEFVMGIPTPNYFGDIFGTLGGKRDFGLADPPSVGFLSLTLEPAHRV